ncbi:MAG: hypothetical protein ACLUZQ_08220 [Butyricicoccus sp.]
MAKRINSAVFPGTQGGPLEHVIASRRFALARHRAGVQGVRTQDRRECQGYGCTAAGTRCRYFPAATTITCLVDRPTRSAPADLEARLDSVHITANKNTVPGEKRSLFITSGVRLAPAATTRGMGGKMKVIADCIADCLPLR